MNIEYKDEEGLSPEIKTVGELIAVLQDIPSETPIIIACYDGATSCWIRYDKDQQLSALIVG
jgi:predicted protein tyrosine phosphatase